MHTMAQALGLGCLAMLTRVYRECATAIDGANNMALCVSIANLQGLFPTAIPISTARDEQTIYRCIAS